MRRARIDTEGRWRIKHGKKRDAAPGREGQPHRALFEIVVSIFGCKIHFGIDREHGTVRRFAVTHAA